MTQCSCETWLNITSAQAAASTCADSNSSVAGDETNDMASTASNEAKQASETYPDRQRRESQGQITDSSSVGARRLPLTGA
jgi:hypothetical protein